MIETINQPNAFSVVVCFLVFFILFILLSFGLFFSRRSFDAIDLFAIAATSLCACVVYHRFFFLSMVHANNPPPVHVVMCTIVLIRLEQARKKEREKTEIFDRTRFHHRSFFCCSSALHFSLFTCSLWILFFGRGFSWLCTCMFAGADVAAAAVSSQQKYDLLLFTFQLIRSEPTNEKKK